MKNNHSIRKALLASFAFFGVVAGSTFAIVSKTGNNGGAAFGIRKRAALTGEVSIDPSEYTEVSSAQLIPKITAYTGTSLSRHLNVQFESQVVEAFQASGKDVFYVIDDSRYTGQKSDPFNTDVPDKKLNGFTAKAEAKNNQKTMYISSGIKYGSKFTVMNTKVATEAMYRTVELGNVTYDAYKSLETIYICSGVSEIESGAFVNVPAGVTFKCIADAKPEGWADDWTDADPSQIQWGQVLDDAKKDIVSQSGSTTSLGDAEDYILGYKGLDGVFGAYPLTISYEKTTADGQKVVEYQELPTKHQTNPYDAVGSKIYGKTNSFDVIINLNKGETIDENSYEFYNIFKAVRLGTETKAAWPTDKVSEVIANYGLPTSFESAPEGFMPTLEGDQYFYQTYETTTDKYITVATEFDAEDDANALADALEAKLTTFAVAKDEAGTKEDLAFALQDEFDVEKYGKVYKVLFEKGDVRTNVFVQFYVYHNEANEKFEFVTYVVLDNPVDEVDEEGNPTGKLVNAQNPFPIVAKKAAVRPFIYIPEYKSDDAGNRVPKHKMASKAVVRFKKMIVVDELLTTQYKSSSSFLGYTSVGMNVDKTLGTAYAAYLADAEGKIDEKGQLKAVLLKEDGKYYNGADAYEANQVKVVGSFKAPLLYIEDNSSRSKVETNINSILSGEIRFRYTLTNLNTSSLIVSYREGGAVKTKELPIKSPSPVIEINQDNANIVSFLINNSKLGNVKADDILAVGVSGMTINIHLYNSTSHAVVQNTQFLNVFGNIEVKPYDENPLQYFNIDLYLTLFFIILTAGYAALAVVLFFYKKNKYKNDEFRRVRPKAYIKSAILGYVGLALIAAAINFIVLRFGVFNSTVPTFNPIDAFVIAFTIAGAISLGVFIKNLIAAIKVEKKRREIIRLNLDKDVVDDGTH